MDIKKVFSFKGRISRRNYFLYQLFLGIPIVLLQIISNAFFTNKILLFSILLIFQIPSSIVLTCKSIQRLHDINISGSAILIQYIITYLHALTPNYNLLPFLLVFQVFLQIKKGTEDSNRYGEAPLE